MNKLNFFVLSIFINIVIVKPLFAFDMTYIICANQDKNWFWLKDSSGEYISVYGKWDVYFRDSIKPGSSFKYFLLEKGEFQYESLWKRCRKKFGKNYFPQPADNSFSDWTLFKTKDGLCTGHLDIIYYIRSLPPSTIVRNKFIFGSKKCLVNLYNI